jgi:hypothetical protein
MRILINLRHFAFVVHTQSVGPSRKQSYTPPDLFLSAERRIFLHTPGGVHFGSKNGW